MEWLHDLLTNYGLVSMFLLSFLASSVLPIASEWLLVVLVLKGLDPIVVLLTATTGNYLGACTTYGVGYLGSEFMVRNVLRMTDESKLKAERFYRKYGVYSLLMSWIPIIGDPLCVVAGILRVQFLKFSVLVYIGKFIRYGITTYLALKGQSILM